jgi:hypothetical protein
VIELDPGVAEEIAMMSQSRRGPVLERDALGPQPGSTRRAQTSAERPLGRLTRVSNGDASTRRTAAVPLTDSRSPRMDQRHVATQVPQTELERGAVAEQIVGQSAMARRSPVPAGRDRTVARGTGDPPFQSARPERASGDSTGFTTTPDDQGHQCSGRT